MAKTDVPPLGPVPKKRRQLEQALDVHLAMWLARDDLTPSERRRVGEEKDRRKARVLPVIIGFTATREGMTPPQRRYVRDYLEGFRFALEHGVLEAHHGDCDGGDEQFHGICRDLGIPVVLHPPEDGKLRAYCEGAERSEKVKPFLERNKDIVRVSTELLACPKEGNEPAPGRGQGTWSTIRYARKRDSTVRVVMPDGELLGEESDG